MSTQKKVRDLLMSFAKSASSTPTVMDGRGGATTVTDGTITTDPGLKDVKVVPPTGALPTVANPIGANPSLTVADAREDTASASISVDPGLSDLKKDLPQGTSMKCASERVAAISALLLGKKPSEIAAPAPAAKSAGQQTPAPAGSIVLDDSVLIKIAKAIISTEEGVRYAVRTMEKAAGAERAREFVNEAIRASAESDREEYYKAAAYDQIAESSHRIYGNLLSLGIDDEQAQGILKQASEHEVAMAELDDLEKIAYAGGMDDAAAMEAAEAGEEGAPPVDEAIPMGGDEISPEQIQAVIESLLAEGVITPEELEAAIMQASGGAADPAAAAAEPAAAPAAAEPAAV